MNNLYIKRADYFEASRFFSSEPLYFEAKNKPSEPKIKIGLFLSERAEIFDRLRPLVQTLQN